MNEWIILPDMSPLKIEMSWVILAIILWCRQWFLISYNEIKGIQFHREMKIFKKYLEDMGIPGVNNLGKKFSKTNPTTLGIMIS